MVFYEVQAQIRRIFLDGYCVLDVRTAWVSERLGWGAMHARPDDGVDGIMPPKMMKRKAVKKMVKKRIAEAIEEYEKTRANPDNAGGSGLANTGGIVAPDVQRCSYKTFMNCKPHPFNVTKGVVGLKRWFEKMKQVFEISKCAEDDKVRFEIPWSNVKTMMTTEYCPATEIQRMEQELWNHTLKGDDIEAYNNRFYELALMCPDLVTPKKKKIERYIRGLPERVKV
ncbi:putative reverse transcriptase domain-containing protein [Tanacetum coccineum]